MIFLPVLYLVIILFLLVKYQKKYKISKHIDKFDRPTQLPIFGSIHQLLCSNLELVAKLLAFRKIFKSPVSIWVLWQPIIFIWTQNDIAATASKLFEKHELYRTMSVLLGNGLLVSKEKQWKRSKKIMSSAFNMSILSRNFLEVFNNHNAKLIEKFNAYAQQGDKFDLWSDVFKSSYDTIYETTMGVSSSKNEEQFTEEKNILHRAIQMVSNRILSPWIWPTFCFKIYLWYHGNAHIMSRCRENIRDGLMERKRILEKNRILAEEEYISADTKKKHKSLVDILLNMKDQPNQFSDNEILNETLTIIIGGSETTALTVCFALLTMGIKQDIQERVHNELKEVFGDSNDEPTLEELQKLVYLEQCIKETLRRYCIIPVTMRTSSDDIVLSDGRVIPADVNVILAFCGVHLDQNNYPDPETWNPSNFDADKVANRSPGTFIPFGVGLRTCTGSKYAMLSMKAQLSTILRRFKVICSMRESDILLYVDILVRSVTGFPVTLEIRN